VVYIIICIEAGRIYAEELASSWCAYEGRFLGSQLVAIEVLGNL